MPMWHNPDLQPWARIHRRYCAVHPGPGKAPGCLARNVSLSVVQSIIVPSRLH